MAPASAVSAVGHDNYLCLVPPKPRSIMAATFRSALSAPIDGASHANRRLRRIKSEMPCTTSYGQPPRELGRYRKHLQQSRIANNRIARKALTERRNT